MIFVTLGSQKFQFNRLLKEIDRLIEEKIITEDVFAQIGYSDYKPQNFKYKEFLDRDEFSSLMKNCDKVITHGGTGAIITAVKASKKVIAVPRLAKYNEHVDNHQLQLASVFDEMNIICMCEDVSNLKDKLEEIELKICRSYESNSSKIMESIEEFLKI